MVVFVIIIVATTAASSLDIIVFAVPAVAEEICDWNGRRLRLAVCDVVVGEAALGEHATFGFIGWRSSLETVTTICGGGRFLLLFLFFHDNVSRSE